MKFVQKSGTWNVQTGGRSDTPSLSMPDVINHNTLRITATFLAKTAGDANSGFTYTVKSTDLNEVQALSAQQSIVQGNAGFQTTTKTVFFVAKVSDNQPTVDLDFEVIFEDGGFDGQGEISDFLLTGEIVSLEEEIP